MSDEKPVIYKGGGVSIESPDTIRANECDTPSDFSLATRRFRALWNEIERLRALVDGRWKDAAEAHLKSAGPSRDGTFEFNIKAGIVPLIAEHLAATFKAAGAENFIEIEVNHDELGPLMLTMRRRFGKMPSTVAAEERARADAAEAIIARMRAMPDDLRAEIEEEMDALRNSAPRSITGTPNGGAST